MNAEQGPTLGMAVTTFFGTVWWLAALRFVRATPGRIGALAAATLVLVAATVQFYEAHGGMADAPARANPPPGWGTFSIVVNTEWIAIVLAVIVLRIRRRADLIISFVALIVGLHFLPLAMVFGAPLYYFAGGGMILGAAAGFLFSGADRRRAFTCAVCGSTLWICTALIWAFGQG